MTSVQLHTLLPGGHQGRRHPRAAPRAQASSGFTPSAVLTGAADAGISFDTSPPSLSLKLIRCHQGRCDDAGTDLERAAHRGLFRRQSRPGPARAAPAPPLEPGTSPRGGDRCPSATGFPELVSPPGRPGRASSRKASPNHCFHLLFRSHSNLTLPGLSNLCHKLITFIL